MFTILKYIVYKTTNKINGKIYVGVHRTNPDMFDGYIGCGVSKKDRKKNQKGFAAAVKKYGYENFIRETLFEYPDTEIGREMAYDKEAEIVTIDFVKRSDTYNLTIGGKRSLTFTLSKCISQYSLDGLFIRTWSSITEAENALGLTTISQCLTGKYRISGEFQWKYYDGSEENISPIEINKTIYQFDLQGSLIKTWKNISEASGIFKNKNSARVLIQKACSNNNCTAYGYYWSYKCKFEYIPPKRTAVAKYNDLGEFIESYNSVADASRDIKVNQANIIAAIAGRQKRCAGFRWRYFFGNTNNIKPL